MTMEGITPGFEPLAISLCQSLAESGPVSVAEFDDAWTPAGQTYLDELLTGGFIEITGAEEDPELRVINLTGAGVSLVQANQKEGE